jgi:hypothetical protein
MERVADHYRVSFGDRDQVFASLTQADALDTIANVTRTQDRSTPLRIHLEGFSPDEARNVRAQADRVLRSRSEGAQDVETVTFGGSMEPEHARQFGASRPLHQLEVPTSTLVNDSTIELSLTGKPGKLTRFVAKIRLLFSTKISEPLHAKARSIIEHTMSLLRRNASVNDLGAALQRELTKALKEDHITVDVQITLENGDVWFVERMTRGLLSRS